MLNISCELIPRYQSFGGTYSLHLQDFNPEDGRYMFLQNVDMALQRRRSTQKCFIFPIALLECRGCTLFVALRIMIYDLLPISVYRSNAGSKCESICAQRREYSLVPAFRLQVG